MNGKQERLERDLKITEILSRKMFAFPKCTTRVNRLINFLEVFPRMSLKPYKMRKCFYATGSSSRYTPLAEFMKVPSEWKSGPAFQPLGFSSVRHVASHFRSALLQPHVIVMLAVRLPPFPDSRARAATMETSRGSPKISRKLYKLHK